MHIYHYLPISYLTANNNSSKKITSLTEKVSHRSLLEVVIINSMSYFISLFSRTWRMRLLLTEFLESTPYKEFLKTTYPKC